MCGIAGILFDPTTSEKRRPLESAMSAMQHRGPDQSSAWIDPGVGLAHCRLSIIDLSERGRQPMHSHDGNASTVFNGEIYNFQELKNQLTGSYPFQSDSDTEVLLAAYQAWGIDQLIEKINGMYCFAIWDSRQETLHLVRDRCGKKPLFYTYYQNQFYFASTLVALLAMTQHRPDVSISSVAHYLNTLSIPSPVSIYEGVAKLPPASHLMIKPGQQHELKRYWNLSFDQKENRSDNDWIEAIDHQLRVAVKDRMVSDVPIVAFLSGGVDSSIVASMMADLNDDPVTTISIGFPEERFNELQYARIVANKWNTQHFEHIVDTNSIDILPELIHHFGEPFADHSALPSYLLSEIAKQHGTVVLTGDGGDEGFGGYETARIFSLFPMLRPFAGWPLKIIANWFKTHPTRSNTWQRKAFWLSTIFSKRNGNYVFDPIGVRNFRFLRDSVFSDELIQAARQAELDANYLQLWESHSNLDWADRSFLADFEYKLPNTFLTKVDVATMAHSLEARSPFLDYRLLELAARIPSSVKINSRQSKWLLKKVAEKYVPNEVIYRRKQGFTVPLDDWFRTSLKDYARDILLSDSANSRGLFKRQGVEMLIQQHLDRVCDHGQRIWSLLILELWFQMFVDRGLSREQRLGQFQD